MTSLSVLESPNIPTIYPEAYELSTFSTVAANSIAAYKDFNNTPQNFTIGASSNVRIEAVENVQLYMGGVGDFELYTTQYDANTKVRVDEKVFNVSADATQTTVAFGNNEVRLLAGDVDATFFFNDLKVFDSNAFKVFDTDMTKGFLFKDTVSFGGDVLFKNDLIVASNVYANGSLVGHELALFKNKDTSALAPNDPLRVGYVFNINSNDQLELIKYTRFFNGLPDAQKKVAVYGMNGLLPTDINNFPNVDVMQRLNAVSFQNGTTSTRVGTAAAPINGGSVIVNLAQTTSTVIELSSTTDALAISYLPTPLTTSEIGLKGTVTIIERSTTGRTINFPDGVTSFTDTRSLSTVTTFAPAGGYAVDQITYVVTGVNQISATYANLSIYTPPIIPNPFASYFTYRDYLVDTQYEFPDQFFRSMVSGVNSAMDAYFSVKTLSVTGTDIVISNGTLNTNVAHSHILNIDKTGTLSVVLKIQNMVEYQTNPGVIISDLTETQFDANENVGFVIALKYVPLFDFVHQVYNFLNPTNTIIKTIDVTNSSIRRDVIASFGSTIDHQWSYTLDSRGDRGERPIVAGNGSFVVAAFCLENSITTPQTSIQNTFDDTITTIYGINKTGYQPDDITNQYCIQAFSKATGSLLWNVIFGGGYIDIGSGTTYQIVNVSNAGNTIVHTVSPLIYGDRLGIYVKDSTGSISHSSTVINGPTSYYGSTYGDMITTEYYIYKFDAQGVLQWYSMRYYSNDSVFESSLLDSVILDNESIVSIGFYEVNNSACQMNLINADGSLSANSFTFIFDENSSYFTWDYLYIVALSSSGNVLWTTYIDAGWAKSGSEYGGRKFDVSNTITKTPDNGVVVAAGNYYETFLVLRNSDKSIAYTLDATMANCFAAYVKYNSAGNVAWFVRLDGDQGIFDPSVVNAYGNGFMCSCMTLASSITITDSLNTTYTFNNTSAFSVITFSIDLDGKFVQLQ